MVDMRECSGSHLDGQESLLRPLAAAKQEPEEDPVQRAEAASLLLGVYRRLNPPAWFRTYPDKNLPAR